MEQLFLIQLRWLMWVLQAFFGGGALVTGIAARRACRNRRLDRNARWAAHLMFLLYLAVALSLVIGFNPVMEIVVREGQVRVQYARGTVVLAPGDVRLVREVTVSSKSGRGVGLEIVTVTGKVHRTISIPRTELPVLAGAMAGALDLTRVIDNNQGLRTWRYRGTPTQ